MKCIASIPRALLASAALCAVAALAPVANASPANGELCSVATSDGAIFASVYAYPYTPANRAPKRALDRAGQWCTNQIGIGLYGSDNHFDAMTGDILVCFVHVDPEPIVVGIYSHADYYSMSDAEDDCNQVGNYDPHEIAWYPNGSSPVPAANPYHS